MDFTGFTYQLSQRTCRKLRALIKTNHVVPIGHRRSDSNADYLDQKNAAAC